MRTFDRRSKMRLCRRELREVKVLADALDTAAANLTRGAVAVQFVAQALHALGDMFAYMVGAAALTFLQFVPSRVIARLR
jgi:hypothetical protein